MYHHLRTQVTQTAPTPMFARPSDVWSASRVRQRGMTFGEPSFALVAVTTALAKPASDVPEYRRQGRRARALWIDLAHGEYPDYFKFIGHVLSPSSDRFLCAHFVPGLSKMVLNRETNPKWGTRFTVATAINHRAPPQPEPQGPLVVLTLKKPRLVRACQQTAGTGVDGGVGGLATRDIIKSGPQVDVLQLHKRARLDTAEDMVVNSSPLSQPPPN
ncbi:hypothetical protein EDB86DRAFT_2825307 [Lactarius hatsudake]|nr:hypothetical protein EDB86DRAFT_2825307 [Lactarius hatsudake]